MIDGIQIKVCGLTSLVDADFADACGADYLGFILHPASPRRISLSQFKAMHARLPPRKKVAVSVEPDRAALREMREAGFDRFQIHFGPDIAPVRLGEWSLEVGSANLWLAPKLPPGVDFSPAWLSAAQTVLLDTFDPELYGGTGRVGDWAKFRRLAGAHPGTRWILSGGLSPENIGEALRATGSRFVDVNSGVESAPGVKDHAKLKAFIVGVHKAAGTV